MNPLTQEQKELLLSALNALKQARFAQHPNLNCSGKQDQDIAAMREIINQDRIYEREQS